MRSILQHLRFHFSFFLLPVYLFAISQSANPDYTKAIWAFIILHLLVYPASNAYNSYFDKDEGPIGGIEKPLPVNIQLYYVSIIIDIVAVILSILFCSWPFALGILVYGLISKAYSHPIIRLKKYPILSWMVVGLFQGAFIYLLVFQLISKNTLLFLNHSAILPALLTSFNLWAFYPITQVYQHDEDAKRGDITLSLKLGIKGTFVFTGSLFLLSTIGFFWYFSKPDVLFTHNFILYLLCMAPSLIFFNYWVFNVWKDESTANFKNTMMMNLLGSLCLNIFFGLLLLKF
jgi:UbiA prenyltransferase family